ncbi:MAG: NAD-dependent succinate-semialdehyde dehydrogenase [Bacteroidota bacterium]
MNFKSINPFDLQLVKTYESISAKSLGKKIRKSEKAFSNWGILSPHQRIPLFTSLSEVLLRRKEELAHRITLEMGKPITESVAEIEKCALVCRYYAEKGEIFLADKTIALKDKKAWVSFEPTGGVLGIMPWNFPFWQVFRFAVPTLMAGNTVLLKHSSNVPGCAQLIEDVFLEAGFAIGIFQNLLISDKKIKKIIEDDFIQGVSLTGSVRAGAAVGEIAGKNIKRTVLELGGSNAFLVFADADIDKAVKMAITGRFGNAGQSCIAAKRFIVHESVHDEFQNAFAVEMMKLKVGNPIEKEVKIGPLARPDLAETLDKQVQRSLKKGAKLLLGGTRENCFYQPTLLSNVTPGMPAFDEELFGPVAALIKASNDEEMINFANRTQFGLGVNLFSQDVDRMKQLVRRFNEGAVFINDVVKSDPVLPFGGVKKSGIGRELGEDGIKAFVNIKTVVIA